MSKDTTILSELQENFLHNDSHKAINRIMFVMSSIRLREHKICKPKKPNCKFTVLQVFHLLLLFPFFRVRDAYHYGSSALGRLFECRKDMFYRFMERDDVDWRNIIYLINKQLITRLSVRSDFRKGGSLVCLVADDTDMPKAGLCIENIGRIYSHVLHISRLGFKGLFLGRTDGKTQTVLDCALVGEKGKNADKPNGMTQARIKRRFTRQHDDKSPARRRVDEYGTDKQTLLRDMIRRAIKKGLRFDYLLVDSWFTCKELVHFIKRRHFDCHLLGMIKMGNTRYETSSYGSLTAKGCIDKLKRVRKGIRYSKALKCYYGQMDVILDGVEVRLFFCRRGRKGSWNGLLTTNTAIDFLEAYRIYAMRWCIEVSFEEMKGYLRLGKCQARNFNTQIASISITIIQYNMLCYLKRFDSYETIGGLFGEITAGTAEMSITDKIWLLIVEFIMEIAERISADYHELMREAINRNSHLHAMFAKEYNRFIASNVTCES